MISTPSPTPGDLILDRYLPAADPAARERARAVLRDYALALLRLGEREARASPAQESPESAGRLMLEGPPPAAPP